MRLLGTEIFKRNFISKENMKRYDNMCNNVDKKFKDLISIKTKEIIMYYDETIEVQLGFLNYVQCNLFYYQLAYGLSFEIEDDYKKHCYKVRILQEYGGKDVRNNI